MYMDYGLMKDFRVERLECTLNYAYRNCIKVSTIKLWYRMDLVISE